MRVVHVTYQHSADDARILHKECRSLAEAGFDVHLIAPGPPPGELHSVTLHPLSPHDHCRKLSRIRAWFGEIVCMAGDLQPAIIHLHDPLLLAIRRRLRKAAPRANLVYDVHEDHLPQALSLMHLPLSRRIAQAALFAHLEFHARRMIDCFVAATPGIAAKLPRGKTVVVRNLPRLSEFPVQAKPAASRALLYVGGLTEARGLFEMLDAMVRMRDPTARLLLAGKFDIESTRHRAHSDAFWQSATCLGWVPHARIPELLTTARAGLVVLHPKRNYLDAWPVKLFEYMAAGLPFIASDFPAWREMLGGERCGLFVDPLNPRAIADAMQHLLSHDDEAQAMGAAGRALIERELNWEREAQTLIKAYERL